jgi:peptide/nickel transport system permease protein
VAGSIPASASAEEAPAAGALRIPAVGSGAAPGLAIAAIILSLAALAGHLAPAGPFATVGPPLAAPSAAHPLGTDDLGRDLLAGIAHGARTSLVVVAAVAALTFTLGVGAGALAGFRGGLLDEGLMRAAELVQVVPRFFLAVLVVALSGPGLDRIVLVLGLTSWPATARVVRAETLSVQSRAFVEAARALGASPARLLLRHVLPVVLPPAIVVLAATASAVILLEASLSFLGLGDPARMSWGYLASNAQRFLRVAWWMAAFPGAAIAAAILGLNLLADALNDRIIGRRAAAPGR